jgi:hypothetical protein
VLWEKRNRKRGKRNTSFSWVDGDKVVRFQARRETELKLSKNNREGRRKKSSENDDRVFHEKAILMRVFFSCTAARPEWKGIVSVRSRAKNLLSRTHGKTWKGRKNVMYELRNFSFSTFFYGTFMRKSFLFLAFRFTFSIYLREFLHAAQLTTQTRAPRHQFPTVRSLFYSLPLRVTHRRHTTFGEFSPRNYDTNWTEGGDGGENTEILPMR